MPDIKGIRIGKFKDFSMLSLFIISMAITMLYCVFYKSDHLLQINVLSQENLSLFISQSYSKGEVFFYLLQKRMCVIPFLFLLSTTYLAMPMVYGMIIRYGIALGSVLSVVMLRYGIRGFLFLALCSMPQYLFYVPACILAFRLCARQRIADQRFMLQCVVLESVVLIGCFLESFVNLSFLRKVLKIFI